MRDRVNSGACVSVAIDLPSGIDGDTGAVRGAAAPAALTITFFRPKPGHVLLPGRTCCGLLRVIDIGIPDRVLEDIRPSRGLNRPSAWSDRLPVAGAADHKYRRGHAVIAGGATMTGAARLAAAAARRSGAGLLTLSVPQEVAGLYRATMPGALVEACDSDTAFVATFADQRRNAVLVGPGLGRAPVTRDLALAALASRPGHGP